MLVSSSATKSALQSSSIEQTLSKFGQDSSWISSRAITHLQWLAGVRTAKDQKGSMGAKWLFQLRSAPGQQVVCMYRIACGGTRWLDDVCPHCHGLHGPHESEYQTGIWCALPTGHSISRVFSIHQPTHTYTHIHMPTHTYTHTITRPETHTHTSHMHTRTLSTH